MSNFLFESISPFGEKAYLVHHHRHRRRHHHDRHLQELALLEYLKAWFK
jgi:hypothetical protein